VVRASTQKERVPIRCGRKVVAAVVPVQDLRLIEELEDRLDVEEAECADTSRRRSRSPTRLSGDVSVRNERGSAVPYTVLIDPRAARELEALPSGSHAQVGSRLQALGRRMRMRRRRDQGTIKVGGSRPASEAPQPVRS
jgi:hypothetical protein